MLVKFNATGVKQWTRLLGTAGHDHAFGVHLTAMGMSMCPAIQRKLGWNQRGRRDYLGEKQLRRKNAVRNDNYGNYSLADGCVVAVDTSGSA